MFGIRAGRAFDGERVVPGGALVLVDDGRIAKVEPGAAPAPEDCQVLDVPDGTVLPGLVDAHVHLCADGTDGTLDRIGEPSQDAMMTVIEQSLRRHLAAGVTTVRDLGTAGSPCWTGARPPRAAACTRPWWPRARRSPASAATAPAWAARPSARISCVPLF
jgi:imidazolonepropionase-like amidohydrolase